MRENSELLRTFAAEPLCERQRRENVRLQEINELGSFAGGGLEGGSIVVTSASEKERVQTGQEENKAVVEDLSWVCCDGCDDWLTFEQAGIEVAPEGDWLCNLCVIDSMKKAKSAKRRKKQTDDDYSSYDDDEDYSGGPQKRGRGAGASKEKDKQKQKQLEEQKLELDKLHQKFHQPQPKPPKPTPKLTVQCLGVMDSWDRCEAIVELECGFCATHTFQRDKAIADAEKEDRTMMKDPRIEILRRYLDPINGSLFKTAPLKNRMCPHRIARETASKLAEAAASASASSSSSFSSFSSSSYIYQEFKCPIVGCASMWTIGSTTFADVDFFNRLSALKKDIGPETIKQLESRLCAPGTEKAYSDEVHALTNTISKLEGVKKFQATDFSRPIRQATRTEQDDSFVHDWIGWIKARSTSPLYSSQHNWRVAPMPVVPRKQKEIALALLANQLEPDCQMIDTGPRKEDFNDPFTLCPFNMPMTNGFCKHHIDRASLQDYCKGNPHVIKKCPVSGCSQVWTLGGAKLDVEFQEQQLNFMKTVCASLSPSPSPSPSPSASDYGAGAGPDAVENEVEQEKAMPVRVAPEKMNQDRVPIIDLCGDD